MILEIGTALKLLGPQSNLHVFGHLLRVGDSNISLHTPIGIFYETLVNRDEKGSGSGCVHILRANY